MGGRDAKDLYGLDNKAVPTDLKFTERIHEEVIIVAAANESCLNQEFFNNQKLYQTNFGDRRKELEEDQTICNRCPWEEHQMDFNLFHRRL